MLEAIVAEVLYSWAVSGLGSSNEDILLLLLMRNTTGSRVLFELYGAIGSLECVGVLT